VQPAAIREKLALSGVGNGWHEAELWIIQPPKDVETFDKAASRQVPMFRRSRRALHHFFRLLKKKSLPPASYQA
jgi:hypothetical protein